MRAAVLAFLTVLLVARTARAIPYETFIDIEDQSDLDDLLAAQDITQDTYDELLDLLGSGVDLNTADRAQLYSLPNLTYDDVDKILAYRALNKGVIRDPAELAAANALSQEKLLAISAFLVVRPPGENPLNLHGWVRGMTRYTIKDKLAPPFALRARFTALKHLQAGIAMTTTRLRIGDAVYDPNRDALIASRRSYQFHLPKAFVKWEDEHYDLIGGSFRAGFAQRLIFDNSRGYSPNGFTSDDELFYSVDLDSDCRESAGELATSPCTGAKGSRYTTPDFAWRDGLLGAGVGIKKLAVGSGWLQAYAWASASKRSIYQYELYVKSDACPDPHDDANPACAAPNVFVRPDGNILTPTSRYAFVTLPNVFAEKLVGGNVTYFADRRNSVGATAYGATETNLISGIDLDLQEWSRIPTGKTFGAAGGNFSFGRSWLDVFGEAGVSFDKSPAQDMGPAQGGGGPAAILRITATKKKEELEAVFRYYSIGYANPFSRPISQPDEFDGQRARDEVGGRLRYVRTDKKMTLRAALDVWVPPSTLRDDAPAGHAQPKVDTYVRGDVRTTDEIRLGLWLRYQDKDLKAGGHDQCFEVSTETSPTGDPVPCSGRQLTSIGRMYYQPDKKTSVTLMLEHQLLDDRTLSKTSFRQDLAGWAIGTYHPNNDLRVRGRLRYLDEAIEDNTYLERSVSGLVDASFRVRERDLIRVRVDSKFWLDKRTSTDDRVPNPEVQLWLSYEARL